MRNGIPICDFFSDPHQFAYGDPHMHTAIPVCKITHMGIQDLIVVVSRRSIAIVIHFVACHVVAIVMVMLF